MITSAARLHDLEMHHDLPGLLTALENPDADTRRLAAACATTVWPRRWAASASPVPTARCAAPPRTATRPCARRRLTRSKRFARRSPSESPDGQPLDSFSSPSSRASGKRGPALSLRAIMAA